MVTYFQTDFLPRIYYKLPFSSTCPLHLPKKEKEKIFFQACGKEVIIHNILRRSIAITFFNINVCWSKYFFKAKMPFSLNSFLGSFFELS